MSIACTPTITTPDLQFGISDTDYVGGHGGSKTCDWQEDGICTDTATNYITKYMYEVQSASEHVKHTLYYCPKHYVLELDHILVRLQNCARYDECTTPDEIQACTLEHVVDFGSL